MTDEQPKTLEEKTLSEVKSILTSLNSETSWIKAHAAWLIGLGCFVLGAAAGHFIHH